MQQSYTVNEYREEPEDKKKRKKKKKDSLEGGFQVDLKGPSVELGKIYSFVNRIFYETAENVRNTLEIFGSSRNSSYKRRHGNDVNLIFDVVVEVDLRDVILSVKCCTMKFHDFFTEKHSRAKNKENPLSFL